MGISRVMTTRHDDNESLDNPRHEESTRTPAHLLSSVLALLAELARSLLNLRGEAVLRWSAGSKWSWCKVFGQ